MTRSPITTHVLDLTSGKPVFEIPVKLEFLEGSSWKELASAKTNKDGRVEDLLQPGSKANTGQYRIHFQTSKVFPSGFYPEVSIHFEIKNPAEHHHVPLLLGPFGYSTYRGS